MKLFKLLLSLLAIVSLTTFITSCGGDDEPTPPPTLSAPTVTGLFQPEGQLSISFTMTGTFQTGNVFTAQLSDGTGSFANPIAIGTLTSLTAGTINAALPASVANGSGYRIRVVASAPATISPDNGSNLSIAKPTLTITGFQSASTGYVPGREISVSTTLTGTFAACNSFTLQLSNGAGEFTAPVALLTTSPGTSLGATVQASLPANVGEGSGFRLRWISSCPVVTGSPSNAFTINIPNLGSPVVTGNLTAGGSITVQVGLENGPWNASNTTTVQLSDASGSFASPRAILALPTTIGTGGNALYSNILLPTDLPAGTGYRIRFVTTSPQVTGQSSGPLTIGALPTLTIEPGVPTFTKIYSGTSIAYFYTIKVTRTGTFNSNAGFSCQTSFNNSAFGNSEFFFGGFTSTNLTELQNNGFTFVQLQSTNWGTGNRRLRVFTLNHGNVTSNELQMPVFQTSITSVAATIEGSTNNFGTNNFVAGSPSATYVNNQIVGIGGSNASTLFGATTLRMDIILNLSAENVATGSQTARVVVQLSTSAGTIAVYNNNSVTLSVSGTPTGYTVTGAGPYTLTRTSGSAGNTSITLQSVSASFAMQ
jgi:hypothetical protein